MSVSFVLSALAILTGVLLSLVLVREQARLHGVVERLKVENRNLRRALERQSMFASEVAHELKNPITAIVCAADTLELLLDGDLDEDNRRTLRHIHDYGDHVLHMMQDFIDLTKGESGMLQSRRSLVQPGEALVPVVGLLSPSAARRGVDLQVDGWDCTAHAYIDVKHLKQIVFNLIHNAVKFTPSGGVVILRVHSDATRVLLEVSDTGPGLEESRLSQLVGTDEQRRFAPGDSPTSNGIGLVLVRTLVALEGGRISVRSEPGMGTSIEVAFPLVFPLLERDMVVSTQPVQAKPLDGQSVLVVDQDPGVRDTVARLVEALGGVVDGVGLAGDALAALSRGSYSVIVLDESIEGPNSAALIHRLKDENAGKGARVVVTSSRPAEELAEKGIVADCVVEKPLDRKALIESILQAH